MTEQAEAAKKTIQFRLDGMATIKHLNIRKEGPDEEKVVAADIKLEVKKVDRALCEFFDDALAAFLWRGETDTLIVRNMYVCPLAYVNTIDSATIKIGAMSFIGDVRKFVIEPKDGGVITVGCSVSVEPNSSQVAELAKLVQEDIHIEITGQPGLFDEPK